MKRFSIFLIAALVTLMGGSFMSDAKVKKSTRKAAGSSSTLKIIKSTQEFGEQLDVYARGCDYEVTHTVVVANKSNKDVPGDAYYLRVSPVGRDEYGYSKNNTSQVPGEDIPANGTVTITWTDVHFDGTWSYKDKVTLKVVKR